VAVVAVEVEVIVTDVQNQVILHVIVLNPIHAADKVVVAVHQINKAMMMMMEIKCRMKIKKQSLFIIQRFHFFSLTPFCLFIFVVVCFLFIRISN
jgi:hypothetical protein